MRTDARFRRPYWATLALGLLLGLAGCNTRETVVPNAAVILNPTPGTPAPVYNGIISPGPVPGGWWGPPHKRWGRKFPPGPYPPTACPVPYRVQPGDTVSRLAVRYRTSTSAIVQINNLPNPDYIRIGQVLCIPSWSGTPIAPPTGTPVPPLPGTPPPPLLPTATPGGVRRCSSPYRVRPGDTLDRIAVLCDVNPLKLWLANIDVLNGSDVVYPGLDLTIPGSS